MLTLAVCPAQPTQMITNSQGWPVECLDTPVGQTCTAKCNAGYTASTPTATCKSDGSWSAATTSACDLCKSVHCTQHSNTLPRLSIQAWQWCPQSLWGCCSLQLPAHTPEGLVVCLELPGRSINGFHTVANIQPVTFACIYLLPHVLSHEAVTSRPCHLLLSPCSPYNLPRNANRSCGKRNLPQQLCWFCNRSYMQSKLWWRVHRQARGDL